MLEQLRQKMIEKFNEYKQAHNFEKRSAWSDYVLARERYLQIAAQASGRVYQTLESQKQAEQVERYQKPKRRKFVLAFEGAV